ncbi:DUF2785 domain-containing protein [Streptomyces decoyicus]|uniref:DUF2785 domain-containing protein n=1 Tax=Streptomyces decoyicus TaxID=249567 RepID=UPI00363EFE73
MRADPRAHRPRRRPGRGRGALVRRFPAWYPSERDTRGWDDPLGRLHAVAHGADAAAAFAGALPARRAALLELCAHRMTAAPADYRYAQLEDARPSPTEALRHTRRSLPHVSPPSSACRTAGSPDA